MWETDLSPRHSQDDMHHAGQAHRHAQGWQTNLQSSARLLYGKIGQMMSLESSHRLEHCTESKHSKRGWRKPRQLSVAETSHQALHDAKALEAWTA